MMKATEALCLDVERMFFVDAMQVKDIAKKTGLSTTTVSRVIDDSVPQEFSPAFKAKVVRFANKHSVSKAAFRWHIPSMDTIIAWMNEPAEQVFTPTTVEEVMQTTVINKNPDRVELGQMLMQCGIAIERLANWLIRDGKK